jgi:DNA replication and repair protein RecF
VELATDHQVNIFVGPNAQGKTNLLEAIYMLSICKSHRTHRDKEMIQWNREHAQLACEIEKKYGTTKLYMQLMPKGKKVKINGLEQKKLSDFIGTLNVVMFAPEDLEIVKGSPRIRRRFLDMEIGQVYPGYLHLLQQYQKVLLQRNNVLKQPGVRPEMFAVWDEQLAVYGSKIMKKRQNFISKLQNWAERIHSGITNQQETLKIDYHPSFPAGNLEDETVLLEQFMLQLSHAKEQELRRGMTLYGPHRDDLLFFINGKDVQSYASQGQQRTAALSLKLAEIELIYEEVGEFPLLLLDDVLSELDPYRQTQLIETFQGKVQTFITTTSMDSVDIGRLHDVKMFHVRDGELVH